MTLQLGQETERMFARDILWDLILTTNLLHYDFDRELLLDTAPDLGTGMIGTEQTSLAGVQDDEAIVVKRRSSFRAGRKTKIADFVRHVLFLRFLSCFKWAKDRRVSYLSKSSKVRILG